ncbi:hypothetical protein DKL61_09555 [Gammaproteobacteria bacterium ESL0073]|nr:hypothetical protein DKL61_09555 [Gammaproteobacteria bacterium ESL0073]
MTISNTTTAANSSTQLSVERQLADLIDEVRVSVGPQATLAAKVSFNPKETLSKFNSLIEKAINNIQEELKQAVTSKSSQAIIDDLNKQLNLVIERATTFRNYLNGLSSSTSITRSTNSEQGNALSAWLDEVSPLAEPEDLTEMPFQSLKADRTNVPRDFSVESTVNINLKTRDLNNIDDFFLPEYIASANETEITDDILAKTKELANSPVKIYEWVRNNVEWQPTWGGQQTADMTLDVRRGNAMDISTLMIALLRAAKIPARYVHGTVDIPADNFINMAGNFENVDAAMDFVSAGGIPVTSVTVGGKIAKVRIEHVWVEAAVPFYPSRGAKPVSARNPIDSWIPLDGSYKQYEYLQGIDVTNKFDAERLVNNLVNSGTVSEQEGWIQGLNANVIKEAQQQGLDDLIKDINSMQNPTIGDLTGQRKIIVQTFSMLPGSLPYVAIVRGISNTQLTRDLQVQVTLGLGYDSYTGEYAQQQTYPLYQLNQRNITISFKPASKADEEASIALIPKNITAPEQLPSFYPSSIRMISEIKRDEETLLTSNALALGDKLAVGYHFQTPTQSYLNKKDLVVAGSYLALGIVGSNVSGKTVSTLISALEITKQVLTNADKAQLDALSREKLIGDIFVAGVQSYYAQYIAQSKMMSLQNRVMHQPFPTAGTFGYEPKQKTFFGVNRGVEINGVYMNIRTAQVVKDANGDTQKEKQLMIQAGMMSSALEHAIPEQVFNDKNSTGFSSAKAFTLALAQGQKVYVISQNNKAEILSKISIDALALTEINAALSTGKEVIVHSNPITLSSYTGSGYIIIDPETGAGLYKISGGRNGGSIDTGTLGWILAAIGVVGTLAGISLILMIIIVLLQVFITLMDFLINYQPCGDGRDDVAFWLTIGLALGSAGLGFLGEVGTAIMLAIGGWIFGQMVVVPLSNSCQIKK